MKKAIVIAVGVVAVLFLGSCVVVGVLFTQARKATQQGLTEADQMWNAGDKAVAVSKYKAILQDRSKKAALEDGEKPLVYGRLIDDSVERGDTEAAKNLITEAATAKVSPLVTHPEAKKLLATGPASGQRHGGSPVLTGDVLTAEYLPCIAGNVKVYIEERYHFDTGRPASRTTDKITSHGDNKMTLEWSTASPGQEQTTGKGPVALDVKNDMIEWLGRITIKVGAKPGDEWLGRGITYKLLRFEKAEAQGGGGKVIELQRAVIESRLVSDDGRGGKMEHLTEYVLEKGGGIQTEKEHMTVRGRRALIRDRRLDSSTYQ